MQYSKLKIEYLAITEGSSDKIFLESRILSDFFLSSIAVTVDIYGMKVKTVY